MLPRFLFFFNFFFSLKRRTAPSLVNQPNRRRSRYNIKRYNIKVRFNQNSVVKVRVLVELHYIIFHGVICNEFLRRHVISWTGLIPLSDVCLVCLNLSSNPSFLPFPGRLSVPRVCFKWRKYKWTNPCAFPIASRRQQDTNQLSYFPW